MILAGGELRPDRDLSTLLDGLESRIQNTRSRPPLTSRTVVEALAALGERLDRGELDELISRYAPPQADGILDRVRGLLDRESLEYKLRVELGAEPGDTLERPFGRALVQPLGTLLHVGAGNVDGLPAFSVVEGLLTGNVNLLKLPRDDNGLSLAVLKLLCDQEPALADYIYVFPIPSRDSRSLSALAALADGVVVWGGDGAVRALRALAPPGCRLIEWGHRLSFAYLSGPPDREALAGLAEHIAQTGGLLCSSCQVIYLDMEEWEEGLSFCRRFLPILEDACLRWRAAPGQAGLGSLYAREALLEHVVDRQGRGEVHFPGRGCSLTLREGTELELSPLHGSVLVKLLPRRQLSQALGRCRGRLQTAGLVCPEAERQELAALLARAGVTRVTRAGHMSHTFSGEGHDGEYPLRRYVRLVDVER